MAPPPVLKSRGDGPPPQQASPLGWAYPYPWGFFLEAFFLSQCSALAPEGHPLPPAVASLPG